MEVRVKRFMLLGVGIVFALLSKAQDKGKVLDPSGYINKYDVNFNGIGPQVYVLPAPRTREELLTDSYKEKIRFEDSIERALDLQRVVEEFKPTSSVSNIQYLISPLPKDGSQWEKLIADELKRENYVGGYGLLHVYADMMLKAGDISNALTLLQRALQHAQKTPNSMDVATIQYNLANLFLFERNIQQAGFFQEAFYQSALTQKSIVEQANSLTKIALIQAYDKDYRSAENNIIRNEIPFLNKTKAYECKVIARQTLARIYQLQNKHTEAQWFLIQARDLANSKNFHSELAEIEYMLAFSKFAQKNYRIASKEFQQAEKLAEEEDNKLLQLAIVDKLGQIYMDEKDLNKAEDALNSYHDLRSVLFSKHE